MLAEKKQKTSWVLNPRVNAWSQDDAKFGQRLLVGMGWQKGKGLGKRLHGDPQHVRLNTQTCSKGLGYGGTGDEWLAHQDDFNSLLDTLRTEHSCSSESQESQSDLTAAAAPGTRSLEQSSKQSRTRVHYHRFTRGKDISRYSATDLVGIVGVASKRGASPTAPAPPPPPDVGANCAHDSSSFVTHKASLSLKDYFAEKMKRLRSSAAAQQHSADAPSTVAMTTAADGCHGNGDCHDNEGCHDGVDGQGLEGAVNDDLAPKRKKARKEKRREARQTRDQQVSPQDVSQDSHEKSVTIGKEMRHKTAAVSAKHQERIYGECTTDRGYCGDVGGCPRPAEATVKEQDAGRGSRELDSSSHRDQIQTDRKRKHKKSKKNTTAD